MGTAKGTETKEDLEFGQCLLRMFKLFETQKETCYAWSLQSIIIHCFCDYAAVCILGTELRSYQVYRHGPDP